MRKLLGFALMGILLTGTLSCEDEATNPGDFNMKSELSLDPMLVTSILGQQYALEVEAEYDTAFTSTYEKNDTTFEVDGSGNPIIGSDGKKVPVIGPDGKVVYTTREVEFKTGKTAHFYKMKMVKLDSRADTFTIHIKSNAMWRAPQYAPKKAQWFFNYNLRTGGTSLQGGGDGYFYFRTLRNKNKTRVEPVPQNIYTSDSTVMYQLNFSQAGERDDQ